MYIFRPGDQHVFEDGKFTRELHDAIQDYKTKSKFWLEPDSNGNIISPYNAQEEWAKSNEKMSELVNDIKEAQKIEKEKKELEAELEKSNNVEPMAIHAEPKEEVKTEK